MLSSMLVLAALRRCAATIEGSLYFTSVQSWKWGKILFDAAALSFHSYLSATVGSHQHSLLGSQVLSLFYILLFHG